MELTLSARRFQPLVALCAFRKLVRDPEDTHQVFIIGEALRGYSLTRVTARFRATPYGREVLAGRQSLMPTLTDREALRRLPEGSLGRRYLEFVQREDLSAQGLAEASRARDEASAAPPEEKAFRSHLRDCHDLWHVLTGYGRDPLGEVCLLAFTYGQTGSNGLGVIAWLGTQRIARELTRQPVRRAAREARRLGGRAAWLPGIDWAPLMGESLSALREHLSITPPALYRDISGAIGANRLRAAH
jgi:ubiquinone biosynthesis protein COQ4